VLADKADDNNDLRQTIADTKAEAVITSTYSRKVPISHDEAAYTDRNRIERCFNKLNTSAASPPDTTGEPATSSPSARRCHDLAALNVDSSQRLPSRGHPLEATDALPA
jgi:hypothetical protein